MGNGHDISRHSRYWDYTKTWHKVEKQIVVEINMYCEALLRCRPIGNRAHVKVYGLLSKSRVQTSLQPKMRCGGQRILLEVILVAVGIDPMSCE